MKWLNEEGKWGNADNDVQISSHQVVTEMCLEIAQHMYKAATLAGGVAEELIITQVAKYLYCWEHLCNWVHIAREKTLYLWK